MKTTSKSRISDPSLFVTYTCAVEHSKVLVLRSLRQLLTVDSVYITKGQQPATGLESRVSMSDRTENSDDSRASGTGGRNIRHRNAVIVNVAQPEDVESTPEARSFVRASDIVKIFVGDDEIAEVTMEQVQRVKMSKYGILRATVHWLKAQGTLRC